MGRLQSCTAVAKQPPTASSFESEGHHSIFLRAILLPSPGIDYLQLEHKEFEAAMDKKGESRPRLFDMFERIPRSVHDLNRSWIVQQDTGLDVETVE